MGHYVSSKQIKVNKKNHPRAGHQGPEWEQRYSSNISSTSAQHSGGRSTTRTGRFTAGKERQNK
jgi:hypothetical protein